VNAIPGIPIIDVVLFTFLVASAIAIIRLHDLFAAVMLAGIFSLLSACIFTVLDGVDVAFTEAAVGAGISTVLLLGTLALTNSEEKPEHNRRRWLPLAIVFLVGGTLIYGTFDMPHWGDPDSPVHNEVYQEFVDSAEELGIPNMVTSVLASYRGYDTFGETTVVLTAAVGVLLGFGVSRRRDERPPNDPPAGEGTR
jgi:multicomponent Na+:H+ antiporter subunit B